MTERKTDKPLIIPFEEGQVIFEEGTIEPCMYKIMSGTVALFKSHGSEKELFIKQLEKGDYFGEMAVLESSPRSATAVCKEDCLLLIISQDSFLAFINQYPENALDIMRNLSNNLRTTTSRLEESYSELIDITLNNKQPEPRILSLLERYSSFNHQTNKYEFIVK